MGTMGLERIPLSRRNVLRYLATGGLAGGATIAAASVANATGLGSLESLFGTTESSPSAASTPPAPVSAPAAPAVPAEDPAPAPPSSNDVGGDLIDYAGGVPSAAAIAAAGFKGAIRYVSDRRPGAEWMVGKPMLQTEAQALQAAGLAVVSCYQFGKGDTSDWRGGYDAGIKHAKRGLELHLAAGGPKNKPIYMSIDDNPTFDEFETLIAPFLKGCQEVLGKNLTGVYANAPTIGWAADAGFGTYFWQHNWGSNGVVHPAAHIHQYEIDKFTVDGVGVDRNKILKADYGRW
ncbi:MAG: DUF1906 domain-containing protein [Nocardiaceae bacterium]|nr:DUF1906 domain-containing protein [Nocardiaceae bacterium]